MVDGRYTFTRMLALPHWHHGHKRLSTVMKHGSDAHRLCSNDDDDDDDYDTFLHWAQKSAECILCLNYH